MTTTGCEMCFPLLSSNPTNHTTNRTEDMEVLDYEPRGKFSEYDIQLGILQEMQD